MTLKKIVCLGGGYGNLRIIQKLLPKLPDDYSITLIDRNPYQGVKTEYYALAAGTKSEKDVRVQFPKNDSVELKYGQITNINLNSQTVKLERDEEIQYDYLVIGLGCIDKYHNIPGAEENTYGIQTLNDSRETYKALGALKPNDSVGIVGAGLSGIEIASELRESRSDLKIKLFDRGERILPMYPARLSNYVKTWFTDNDVEIVPYSNIVKVEPHKVYNNEESHDLDVCIWTAGVQPVKVVRDLPIEFGTGGRVILNQYHQIPDFENAFVVGDCAALEHAPSAQVAESQGEQIADVLEMLINGKALPETMPDIKLKGVLGSLGSKEGFAYLKERTVTGRIARMLKSGVLWMYKIGGK